jgi:dienelactone hydrolase
MRCFSLQMFLASAAIVAASGAAAQTFKDALQALAGQAADLKFPAEAKEELPTASSGMAIYKPAGGGPFPALVIVHSCGGIREEINYAAKEALARGYVAFVLDAFGQRGIKGVCIPSRANASVNLPRGTKDALQATAHLTRLPFIDRQKIGILGFSWGGSVGLLASGTSNVQALSDAPGPAAVVAFYPVCFLPAKVTASGRDVEFVRPDHQPPALVLLAGQDNEAPPSECSTRLQVLKDNGVPVDWHLYPDATHCWDCTSLDGLSKTDFQGNRVVYRYNKDLTADSLRRTFEFFDARLKAN